MEGLEFYFPSKPVGEMQSQLRIAVVCMCPLVVQKDSGVRVSLGSAEGLLKGTVCPSLLCSLLCPAEAGFHSGLFVSTLHILPQASLS